jgi:hypothetical protein
VKKVLVGSLAAFLVGLGAAVLAATPAAADYGQGAQYQIEISANLPGFNGGGVWIWTELSTDGTGQYQGADCGHGAQPGAVPDGGTETWSVNSGVITIKGVVLNGLGGFPTTITVSATNGHYSFSGTDEVLTLPSFIPPEAGFTQVQVAP